MFEIQTLICKWDISYVENRKHIGKETLTLLWILVVNYKKVKNYKNCVCVSMATHHERHEILYF